MPKHLELEWLKPGDTQADQELIQELAQPYSETELEAYTVRRLRGKEAVGNSPVAQERYSYVDLEQSQGNLF
ncbi:MAG: hypothetical protein KF803_03000 [Cyclobacteriaceae bacterium]|nr:hypothetical protein [Cyclobacteriaceae bacterium]